MPRHWVHSGDPFGEKKNQLIFSPNGPPSCFYPNRSSHILNPQLLLILEPAEGSEFTERISVLSGLKTESTQKNTKHILCHSSIGQPSRTSGQVERWAWSLKIKKNSNPLLMKRWSSVDVPASYFTCFLGRGTPSRVK